MSNFDNLSDVMTGHNPHQELLKQTRKLVTKWEPTGLLDDIEDSTKKTGMAVLLENQATQLIKEASATSTSSNKEEWSGVALPLVRRIFGELAAQEFVSVQPMNLPSGLIFYLDFKYGTAQAGFNATDQVFGVTSGSGDPTAGLYGAGTFGYSINDVVSATQAASAISASISSRRPPIAFSISPRSTPSSSMAPSNPAAPWSAKEKRGNSFAISHAAVAGIRAIATTSWARQTGQSSLISCWISFFI